MCCRLQPFIPASGTLGDCRATLPLRHTIPPSVLAFHCCSNKQLPLRKESHSIVISTAVATGEEYHSIVISTAVATGEESHSDKIYHVPLWKHGNVLLKYDTVSHGRIMKPPQRSDDCNRTYVFGYTHQISRVLGHSISHTCTCTHQSLPQTPACGRSTVHADLHPPKLRGPGTCSEARTGKLTH